MKLSLALAVVFLPVIVNAQYGAPDPAPSSSSSASSPAVPSAPASSSNSVNVDVAPGGALAFNPSNFTAANGTTVTFFFPQSGTHSVTQSTFANPCTYLAAASGSSGGFDSGVQTAKQFTITITNDQQRKPTFPSLSLFFFPSWLILATAIWFFCKVQKHCGLGMVGSINAPTTGTNTAAAFLAAAKAIGTNEPPVSDSGPMTGGVNAVATATPAATVASPASSPSTSKSSAGHLAASGVFAFVATVFGITLA
ncbi:hypothetical protein BJY52DRAFT_636410 [Lactarius psammicola]|nr:hypothetical protein BJY52DRAFT_636410 [Lactarius psammicola]